VTRNFPPFVFQTLHTQNPLTIPFILARHWPGLRTVFVFEISAGSLFSGGCLFARASALAFALAGFKLPPSLLSSA
jgi:hypothetical protein